jgi:pimeloyl-ACP methyl ester carboxylesterase
MELTRQVFPNARFVALPRAGHHLMIDRPVEFTNLLHGVLQGQLAR